MDSDPAYRRHRLPIVDQDALKRVLEALVDRQRETDEKAPKSSRRKRGAAAVAKRLEMTPGSFSKLRQGKRKYVSFRTYEKIHEELGASAKASGRQLAHSSEVDAPKLESLGSAAREFGKFPPTVLAFGTDRRKAPREDSEGGNAAVALVAEVNRRYEEVVLHRAEFEKAVAAYRLAAKRADDVVPKNWAPPGIQLVVGEEEAREEAQLMEAFESAFLTERQRFAWGHYRIWMLREIERLERVGRPVLEALWEQEGEYKESIVRFLVKVGRSGERLPGGEDPRCQLALLRAVEHLGARDTTWRMESGWKDLHRLDNLKAYLNAALDAQELLFRPRREMERVRSARPPMSFSDWLGEQAVLDDNGRSADTFAAEILAVLERGEGDV